MANNFDRDLDGFFFYPYNFSFPYKILEFPAGNREKSGKGKTAKSKEGKAVRIYTGRTFQEQFVFFKQVTSHLLSSSVGFYSIGFQRGWRA
jgi:hypothetical protein